MKAEWTKAGGAAVTLGEDSARHPIAIEQMGGACLVQVTPLFRAAQPARWSRSNTSGVVAFVASKSHATQAAMVSALKAERARMGEKGSLVFTEGASTITFADAVLQSVMPAGIAGVRVAIRYVFVVGKET